MYKAFLIKYGEIGTKGKNRYIFEDMLVHQIRHALKKVEGTFDVTKENGRIYVEGTSEFDDEDAINALRKVFGILWICPMLQVKDEGFDKLAEDVIDYLRTMYRGKKMTFKVNARRARKNYPLDSMGINMAMGEKILEAIPEMTVDVHNPDIYVNIEIRSRINIYTELIPGPGGMPVGTNGKAMLLLSGGIDSPVAGYMVAKRGVKIDAVYFHAPPYTSDRAKQTLEEVAEKFDATWLTENRMNETAKDALVPITQDKLQEGQELWVDVIELTPSGETAFDTSGDRKIYLDEYKYVPPVSGYSYHNCYLVFYSNLEYQLTFYNKDGVELYAGTFQKNGKKYATMVTIWKCS